MERLIAFAVVLVALPVFLAFGIINYFMTGKRVVERRYSWGFQRELWFFTVDPGTGWGRFMQRWDMHLLPHWWNACFGEIRVSQLLKGLRRTGR